MPKIYVGAKSGMHPAENCGDYFANLAILKKAPGRFAEIVVKNI